jgi:hypothetical protein
MFSFASSYEQIKKLGSIENFLSSYDVDLELYYQLESTSHHLTMAAAAPNFLALMGSDKTNMRFCQERGLDTVVDRTEVEYHIGNPFSAGGEDLIHKFVLISCMPTYSWITQDTVLLDEKKGGNNEEAADALDLYVELWIEFRAACKRFRVLQDPKSVAKRKVTNDAKTEQEKQDTKDKIAATVAASRELLLKSGADVTCMRTINPTYTNKVPAGTSGEVTEDQKNQFAYVNVKWAMGSGIFLEIPSPASFIYSGHYTSVAKAKAARTAANKKAKKPNKE